MADYHINPPPPIEVSKKEVIELVMLLHVIHKQIQEVQRSLPYGPGNIVIKSRLSTALSSIDKLIEFINLTYLQ